MSQPARSVAAKGLKCKSDVHPRPVTRQSALQRHSNCRCPCPATPFVRRLHLRRRRHRGSSSLLFARRAVQSTHPPATAMAYRFSFSHGPDTDAGESQPPPQPYAHWEAEAQHVLRREPSRDTAELLRRLIRTSQPGGGAERGAQSMALMPRLLGHYEKARQAAMAELHEQAERQMRWRYEADEATVAAAIRGWEPAFAAAAWSGDITLLRGVWRESEPFKFSVVPQRERLREAALKLGFPIDPQLFGATAMAIAEREILEARENHELIPSAVPRFMESVLSRMGALCAYKAEGIFRVPGDAVLLKEVAELFEAGELTAASDPRCAQLEVYDWANLLTRWLRQLAEPLVPNGELYDHAVKLGNLQLMEGFWNQISDEQAEAAQALIGSLPVAHKAIVLRLVRFLRHLDPALTQMTPAALSVVFAPSLLRHPELMTAAANSRAEAAFLQLLLTALPDMPGEEVPESEEEEEPEPASNMLEELTRARMSSGGLARSFSTPMMWQWQDTSPEGAKTWREYPQAIAVTLEHAYRQAAKGAIGAPTSVNTLYDEEGERRGVDFETMQQWVHADESVLVRRIIEGTDGLADGAAERLADEFEEDLTAEEDLDRDALGAADDLTMFSKSFSSEASAASPKIAPVESPRDAPNRRLRGVSRISFASNADLVEEYDEWLDPLMPVVSVPTPGSRMERDRMTTVDSNYSAYALDDLYEEADDRSPNADDDDSDSEFWSEGEEEDDVELNEDFEFDEGDEGDERYGKVDSVRSVEVVEMRARLATAELTALQEEEAYLVAELAVLDEQALKEERQAFFYVEDEEKRDSVRGAQEARLRLSTSAVDALRAEEEWILGELAKLDARKKPLIATAERPRADAIDKNLTENSGAAVLATQFIRCVETTMAVQTLASDASLKGYEQVSPMHDAVIFRYNYFTALASFMGVDPTDYGVQYDRHTVHPAYMEALLDDEVFKDCWLTPSELASDESAANLAIQVVTSTRLQLSIDPCKVGSYDSDDEGDDEPRRRGESTTVEQARTVDRQRRVTSSYTPGAAAAVVSAPRVPTAGRRAPRSLPGAAKKVGSSAPMATQSSMLPPAQPMQPAAPTAKLRQQSATAAHRDRSLSKSAPGLEVYASAFVDSESLDVRVAQSQMAPGAAASAARMAGIMGELNAQKAFRKSAEAAQASSEVELQQTEAEITEVSVSVVMADLEIQEVQATAQKARAVSISKVRKSEPPARKGGRRGARAPPDTNGVGGSGPPRAQPAAAPIAVPQAVASRQRVTSAAFTQAVREHGPPGDDLLSARKGAGRSRNTGAPSRRRPSKRRESPSLRAPSKRMAKMTMTVAQPELPPALERGLAGLSARPRQKSSVYHDQTRPTSKHIGRMAAVAAATGAASAVPPMAGIIGELMMRNSASGSVGSRSNSFESAAEQPLPLAGAGWREAGRARLASMDERVATANLGGLFATQSESCE